MKSKFMFAGAVVAFLAAHLLAGAQETSRVIPFNAVPTTIAPGTLGQALTIQLWDVAAGGNVFYCENQSLDVDANGNISFNFGAGTTPTPPCASTPPGLKSTDFPTGTSRFLDVVDGTGTSVLPNPPGRIPLTAVAFALSAPNDVPGNMTFVNSTAAAGNIFKGGALFLSNFGTENTFLGQNSGNLTTSGFGGNTAVGFNALTNNTTGYSNTALGDSAMYRNTTGWDNTGLGFQALYSNTSGAANTAVGFGALVFNVSGSSNTATGIGSLRNNTSGSSNTAVGQAALQNNNSSENTGVGFEALLGNLNGSDNVAVGAFAFRNQGGSGNVAVGANALGAPGSGSTTNVALGRYALGSLQSGSNNIAIGDLAGYLHTSGSNNIDIGYAGFNGDSGVIHIGIPNVQGAAFMAGIYGNPLGGARPVYISQSGQLNDHAASSRSLKEEIVDQGSESDVLLKLRPVAFYYKPEFDPEHTRQYGLIAEEVADVAPNLAVFDKSGRPTGVRYELVNAMLLNEVQKQHRLIEAGQHENDAVQKQLASQQQEIERMNAAFETQQASEQFQIRALQTELTALREALQQRDASLAQVRANRE